MPIIIDTNTISKVFNPSNSDHHKFKPVFDWIDSKNGKMVYGGTKYISELSRMHNYLKLFNLYKDQGKANVVYKNKVDELESIIKDKSNNPKFNDQHLIAIVIVSRCKLICTCDIIAIPFIRDKIFYPNGCSRPIFYVGHPKNYRLLR